MKLFRILAALVVVVMATSSSYAQSFSGAALEFGLPESYDGLVMAPTARFEAEKHVWSVGPTLLFSFGDNIEQRESTKLTGIALGYTNYLQGRDEKVNLFFSVDLWFQQIKDEQNSRYFNPGTSSFEDFKIEQKDKTIQLFFGAGVSLNLTEKLSLSQTIGTGLNATFRSVTSPFNDFSDPLYVKDWLLKTGIEYRF